MMIRAYDEIYLDDAKESLGSALEYAVLVAKLEGQRFFDLFIACGLADEFGRGNVKYLCGMSGIELCREVLSKCGIEPPVKTEMEHIDYPAEYWIGWILAQYQWYNGKTFSAICKRIGYLDLYNLYGILHEADPGKSMDVLGKIMKASKGTNLAALRKYRRLSQSQLAQASGISIRSIQLYEQKKSDINHAQYNHLNAMAKVLGCRIGDLLE
ncbi:MAG: helix-turn-helix domain-containing protein [Clostridiales bacterium]|nr:helix-turn-helix domain-containing protein [Clostridiales bacterium]